MERRESHVEQSPRGGSGALSQLDVYAERLRVQVPPAPENILEGYVKYAPWVAMIVGAFAALALLALLGISALMSPLIFMFSGYRSGASLFEEILFSLLLTVLNIIGGYLMMQRRMTGWWLVAGGLVVYLLQDLLTASILSLLVTLLVAYIHIQIKPRYT
jgi:hypothetical protein